MNEYVFFLILVCVNCFFLLHEKCNMIFICAERAAKP